MTALFCAVKIFLFDQHYFRNDIVDGYEFGIYITCEYVLFNRSPSQVDDCVTIGETQFGHTKYAKTTSIYTFNKITFCLLF